MDDNDDAAALRLQVQVSSGDRRRMVELLGQIDHVQLRPPIDDDTTLIDLNAVTVASVPGAQSAGITHVGPHREARTVAPTDDHHCVLDDVQRETYEGPCLAAAWEHDTMRIDDLYEEQRWLHFRLGAVTRTPIRSILSFRLFDDGKTMVALNMFSRQPGAFNDESVEMSLIYTAHTAVAWNSMRRGGQFRSAQASRDVIGQAKGILMERFDVDGYRAFELLRKLSQDSNVKLNAALQRYRAALAIPRRRASACATPRPVDRTGQPRRPRSTRH